MGSTKVHFTLSDAAIEIVNASAPSPNKRGEWLSLAVIDYATILAGVTDDTECGVLESINQRLARLEKQIAALTMQMAQAYPLVGRAE
jgi:hypothetical protein